MLVIGGSADPNVFFNFWLYIFANVIIAGICLSYGEFRVRAKAAKLKRICKELGILDEYKALSAKL